jgi:hypothetical protein
MGMRMPDVAILQPGREGLRNTLKRSQAPVLPAMMKKTSADHQARRSRGGEIGLSQESAFLLCRDRK